MVASYPGDRIQSIDWKAPHPFKYQQWYRTHGFYLSIISTQTCNLSLRAYEGSLPARKELPPVTNYCGVHLSCLLGTTDEAAKGDMASASVLLGLTPSILAGLGPSLAEVSLLSLRRPILAFLISLGSPAIYPSRVGTYDNPSRVYELVPGALAVPGIKSYPGFVSAAEYLLAAAAIANVFQVSYDIGVRGVLGWWCEFSFAPIFWTLLTAVIHLFASLALRISLTRPKGQVRGTKTIDLKSTWAFLTRFIDREWTLSANNKDPRELDEAVVGPVGVGLQLFAGWFAICHIAFGTAVFAGFSLVGTGDAAILLVRYLASGTVCRLIMLFEIGGMREVDTRTYIYRFIVQDNKPGSENAIPVTSREETGGNME